MTSIKFVYRDTSTNSPSKLKTFVSLFLLSVWVDALVVVGVLITVHVLNMSLFIIQMRMKCLAHGLLELKDANYRKIRNLGKSMRVSVVFLIINFLGYHLNRSLIVWYQMLFREWKTFRFMEQV